MKARIIGVILLLLAANTYAQFADPFSFTTELKGDTLSVAFTVPEKNYIYEDKVGVTIAEKDLTPLSRPGTVEKKDPVSGETITVYDKNFSLQYKLQSPAPKTITVYYAGCDDQQCYIPQSKEVDLNAQGTDKTEQTVAQISDDETEFNVAGSAVGYMPSDKFIEFLDQVDAGKGSSEINLNSILDKYGPLALVLLVILFGLSLNLTPCVLPMIPVNIAIIGAGAQAGSRARGFGLGAVYGLGIAAAYGGLGLLFVLGGKQFGTLNSSPSFNISIGLIFLLMSLAMFGVFNIDFTKFQGKIGSGGKKGSFLTAFFLGSIAALLAGACVAPVILSTLVFALDVYSKGNPMGLVMPFLLGVGMALPWPFAGAGLSFLPKAGGWMEKVKYGFGAIIIAAAAYYIIVGVKLVVDTGPKDSKIEWLSSIEEGKALAIEEDKPLFLDFWANWCKNCTQMDKTTFKDDKVIKRLDGYVKVKFDASDQKKPGVKDVLKKYVKVGLPTYVILKHEK
ncbi:hypothetical protein BVX94_03645 [bacterium B17]|nr:hypothetical protein BVX94_03645 [bacterium B17]